MVPGADQARTGERDGDDAARGDRTLRVRAWRCAGRAAVIDSATNIVSETIRKAGRNVSQNEGLIFEKSAPHKRAFELPPLDVPAIDPSAAFGPAHARDSVDGFPEVSEIEVLRHFTRLSTWN